MLYTSNTVSHRTKSVGKKIIKTVCSITCVAGFSALVLFPKEFQTHSSHPLQVSATFIEGTPSNSNMISLQSIVPTVETQVADEDVFFVHTVQPGDTLSQIASKHGTTVKALQEANNMVDTTLRPGQKLYIVNAPGFVYQLQQKTNLLVFANAYNINLDELMQTNNQTDPLKPYDKGWEIFVPLSQEDGIALGLLEKPDPASFNIYTYQPPKPKAVVQKPRARATTATADVVRSDNATVASTSTPAVSSSTAANGYIIAERYEYAVAGANYAGMFRGHCTMGVVKRTDWLFPLLDDNIHFRTFGGNGNQWIPNAKRAGLITSDVPTPGAVVSFKYAGRFAGAGHVAIVLEVDHANKRLIIQEMNNGKLYRVTQRIIPMQDNMKQAVSKQNEIIGFIPVQDLPPHIQEKYEEQKKRFQ